MQMQGSCQLSTEKSMEELTGSWTLLVFSLPVFTYLFLFLCLDKDISLKQWTNGSQVVWNLL